VGGEGAERYNMDEEKKLRRAMINAVIFLITAWIVYFLVTMSKLP